MFGFGFLLTLIGRHAIREGGDFTPSLDLSDARNSGYFILFF
jgi:hypothetical protein